MSSSLGLDQAYRHPNRQKVIKSEGIARPCLYRFGSVRYIDYIQVLCNLTTPIIWNGESGATATAVPIVKQNYTIVAISCVCLRV